MDPSAWYGLWAGAGLGPKRLATVALALEKRGLQADDLLALDSAGIEALGIPAAIAAKCFEALSAMVEPEPSQAAEIVTPDHPRFPRNRLLGPVPIPVFMYALGNSGLLTTRGISISGSRQASVPALQFAQHLARGASSRGLNVVTGLAAGVDQAAHRAALEAEGTSTGILAEGIDLFHFDDQGPGSSLLVLSQFQPRARWSRFNAMARNATIASLSEIVVVVAASRKGGSWEQAQLCLKNRIPVAVPAFDESLAEGNRLLIKQGAIPLDPQKPEEAFGYMQTGKPSEPEPASLF